MCNMLSCVLMCVAGILVLLELKLMANHITANGRQAMIQLHSDRIDRAGKYINLSTGEVTPPRFFDIVAENSELIFFPLCIGTVIKNTNITTGICFLACLFFPMIALWVLDFRMSKVAGMERDSMMSAMSTFYVVLDLTLRLVVVITCVFMIIWSLQNLS